MSDYRRLISYIYEYEGKEKGKNVGFVKLEARNGQCRLSLSVKKIYVGGNAIGVYLLGKEGNETFLGNLFVRNGGGEFRATVDARNVENSGNNLDTYYGLTIHDVKNTWRSYTTIWEDAVGHTAQEVLPEPARQEASVENVVKEIEEEMARAAELGNEECWGEEGDASCRPHTQDITEADVRNGQELAQEEDHDPALLENQAALKNYAVAGDSAKAAENSMSVSESPESVLKSPAPVPQSAVSVSENLASVPGTSAPVLQDLAPVSKTPASVLEKSAERVVGNEAALRLEERDAEMEPERKLIEFSQRLFRPMMRPERFHPAQQMSPGHRGTSAQQTSPAQPVNPAQAARLSGPHDSSEGKTAEIEEGVSFGQESRPQLQSPELENPEVLKYLQETEEMAADPEKLWMELRRSYPKIQPFDYDNGCEILTIRPQDIGRLPRESWIYGNNSFLLHGYYNFRYLILVRLGSKSGHPRYLIGVPGHYYSNEKYMANMFGFPNFVLSKKQPPNDGRFGYWYTDIRIR